QANIPVPRPRHTLPDYAALIIEDYGDVMLESVIANASDKSVVDGWYQACFEMIRHMLGIKGSKDSLWRTRGFDEAKYRWELEFFHKQFLQQVAGIELTT